MVLAWRTVAVRTAATPPGLRARNRTAGTLRTDTVSFSVILVFVVYIFAALTFFPALALGPVAEHLALWG